MSTVKDVMNDIYITYKKYVETGDLKQWNNRMEELAKRYKNDNFFQNMCFAIGSKIMEEREQEKTQIERGKL